MTEKESIEILGSRRPGCGEKPIYPEGEVCEAYDMAINALEEIQQYRESDKDILGFLKGEWCEAEKVQKALGMTFEQCFKVFAFSRTAEWWSMAGKTEEERKREGQKITCYFRKKGEQK